MKLSNNLTAIICAAIAGLPGILGLIQSQSNRTTLARHSERLQRQDATNEAHEARFTMLTNSLQNANIELVKPNPKDATP